MRRVVRAREWNNKYFQLIVASANWETTRVWDLDIDRQERLESLMRSSRIDRILRVNSKIFDIIILLSSSHHWFSIDSTFDLLLWICIQFWLDSMNLSFKHDLIQWICTILEFLIIHFIYDYLTLLCLLTFLSFDSSFDNQRFVS